MIFSIISMVACSEKVPTVAEYLHDIDSANEMIKKAEKNPEKYRGTRTVDNAVRAIYGAADLRCWPSESISTATTDHACLDAKGYKR
ncbi:hypothetical protein D5041_21430 (plasmid) [Verminephrobacter aporrectodeae subsp. tuberculatae]|nr:hypothetical protein [Verminephrobacter aporrectodeae subsp. tuberculatae]MCW5291487.1 hypothetical protein [Verminephrobacter aporrectodeae subsp. tuberculatae]